MILIFSAPSGSGKSTLVNYILSQKPNDIMFSISATTRQPRGVEQNGKEYYFISQEEFKNRIDNNEFLEYQEVYPGCFYGTLKSEVERIEKLGKTVIFDMDVLGGINLKNYFGNQAMSIFVYPPSLEILKTRLYARGTDTPEVIKIRLEKAIKEIEYAPQFDHIVINDDLGLAEQETMNLVNNFLNSNPQ